MKKTVFGTTQSLTQYVFRTEKLRAASLSVGAVAAARSGSAINQTGSTGTLVPNNSWTSLYTSAGMDSAGDTYVATLQDKAQGRIYRITFMRSDNGSTTGYNIIAERLL